MCLLIATALPVPAANLIWTGAVNTNWDLLTKNWLSNGVAVSYFQGFSSPDPNVTFNDIGLGSVNIAGVVQPGSMTFANNLTNYTFTSNSMTFVIGNTGITLNGKGSVTLNSPNAFTGDTIIDQGTLILGSYGGFGQVLIYNGVPPGNLVFGGLGNTTFEPNEGLANVSQTTTFNNLVLGSGANAQISSNGRGANDTGDVVFNGSITRNVGSSLFINYAIKAGTANNGVYFTNTLPWSNGLLGGGYLHTGSDWLAAQTNFNNGANGPYNYTGYSNNPAIGDWVSTNNISVSNNTASVTASSTVNTLKLSGPATVTISAGQALAIQTGGLLVSSASTGPGAINGGTLVGAPGADLIVLQNYKSSPLTIGSVIGDNGPATALTLGGLGGTLILTNNETYTGATYVNNGTLTLAGGGSISSSPLITVSAGAMIDASQLSSGTLSLASGQTLDGNGTVNGSVGRCAWWCSRAGCQ